MSVIAFRGQAHWKFGRLEFNCRLPHPSFISQQATGGRMGGRSIDKS
jgi:hypothetical protein